MAHMYDLWLDRLDADRNGPGKSYFITSYSKLKFQHMLKADAAYIHEFEFNNQC